MDRAILHTRLRKLHACFALPLDPPRPGFTADTARPFYRRLLDRLLSRLR